jgi:molybdate transport system substrate-binding protein
MTNGTRDVFLACIVTAWFAVSCSTPHQAAPVHVGAAANLHGVLDDIGRAFVARTGTQYVAIWGSTAQLAQQIENGAPIDVFLAADTLHVSELISRGFADPSTQANYARGQLVLWAPSRPDIRNLGDLANASVRQVGCARPELAPYGAAAVQSLKKLGLWPVVEPKLVYAQSISASKQFADSGNVAAAFTAKSLLHNLPGHFIDIDENLHDPIDQALCVVKSTTQPAAARQFRDFMLSDEARAILKRYGYL